MKKQTPQGAAAPTTNDVQPGGATEPPGGWPPDEFTGRAGRYVRDPVTGVRRPAEDAPVIEQPTPEA